MPDNFDQEKIEKAIRDILLAIGEDPDRPGLAQTPERVARSCREIFAGLAKDPEKVLDKVFEEDHDELIAVRDIPVYSVCEHHLQVFHGKAHVAYIPNKSGQVTGLSKLARLVDLYAKRPQIQERLTSQIANALEAKLNPQAVLVIIEAEHLCMTMRGIKKPGAITTTSAVRGLFRKNASSRAEALNLLLREHS